MNPDDDRPHLRAEPGQPPTPTEALWSARCRDLTAEYERAAMPRLAG